MFDPRHVNRRPSLLILLGLVYSSISLLLAYITFRGHVSVTMVFFTVMALTPLVYNSIKQDEERDVELPSETKILAAHAKTIKKFMYIFIGMVLSFSLWFTVLPLEQSTDIFEAQITTINRINAPAATGELTGKVVAERFPFLAKIMLNNTIVLIFCVLFSLLFGFGALFILSWNASVIGAAIGSIFREGFFMASEMSGIARHYSYFQIISYGLMRFAVHGIPEIMGYFVAGLSGGILCFAVIRHDINSKNFRKIFYDSLDLLFISVLLIVFAAVIEVYVSPFIF
ncbi:MAG: stage II sporulation protein M [bacterium]